MRFIAGGTLADVLIDMTTGLPVTGATVGVYRDEGATNRVTDLQTLSGDPTDHFATNSYGIITPAAFPNDDTVTLYAAKLDSSGNALPPVQKLQAHTALDHALALGMAAVPTSEVGTSVAPLVDGVVPSTYVSVDLSDYALKAEVPELGETAVAVPLLWPQQPTGNPAVREVADTGVRNTGLLTLPFPWRLLSVEFVGFDKAVSASDTNYWSLSLLSAHATETTVNLGTYTTRPIASGGGGEITARDPWKPPILLDPAGRDFTAAHSLYINSTPTGTPSNGLEYGTAVVRYQRL